MIEQLFSKYKKTNKLISKEILYSFYNQVSAEIQSGNRNEGVWAKSIVDAEGDEKKTKAIYIELMVEKLILKHDSEYEMQTQDIRKKQNSNIPFPIFIPTDFSEKKIQEILNWYIGSDTYDFFVYSISESQNIYVQGIDDENQSIIYPDASPDNHIIELSGKIYLTNPDILDEEKCTILLSLGWELSRDNGNFYQEVTVEDCQNGSVANTLYRSLKIFGLPDREIYIQCNN